MKSMNENNLIKITVALFLVLSLLVVVALGERKQSKAAKQLLTVVAGMEASKDNKDIKIEDKEVVTEPVKREYTYKGAKDLGVYNSARWKNKKWYVLGDNVKNTENYSLKVKTLSGINATFNDAADGRVMKDITKNITAEKLKDIQLITIFAGANDYSLGTPLGTIKDDENAATFYGSLKKSINNILEVKPDAAIVFITPLKQAVTANKAGVKLENYVQAINEVCKSYNILVYDMFNKSGIDEKNIKSYTTDNVTLNSQGIQKVSQVISDYIKTIK